MGWGWVKTQEVSVTQMLRDVKHLKSLTTKHGLAISRGWRQMGHRKSLFNGGEKVREEAELSAASEERYRKKQWNFTTPLDLSVIVGDVKS